jgi:transposase
MCLLLPKYHCELNPIESYWGAAKRYARFNCDYTCTDLQSCVPKRLESVPLAFFCRCHHFIDSCSYGYDYKLTKFAHKKYNSHRRIPEYLLFESGLT